MKSTVLDLGNYNVKVMGDNNKDIIFKSNISRDYEAYPDGFQYALIDGEYTFFEKGPFSLEYIKTNKNYTAQALFALSKLYEDEESIETNLCLLLPISEMQEMKKYEEQLQNKEFSLTVRTSKKMDKKIKINNVAVVPEGYASYFILDDETKKGSVLIIDVGGRTTNLVAMDNGKPKVLNTYKIGVLDFYLRLKRQNEAKEYSLEDIEKAISKGDIKVTNKDLAGFTNDIINEIKININIDHYNHVIFTGGGALVIQNIIKENLPEHCRVAEDPLSTNIRGALEICKIMFK